ncbi:hypothetical protein ATY76_26765 [Rhizobium sp. R339]|nr:hypothetical protein ATY76_26765 [Rhizobium sp. R339]
MAATCPLIPVLGLDPRDDTGIQPRRVCAVIDLYSVKESSAPKDLGALDSCDEHRNEGREAVSVAVLHTPMVGAEFG